MTTALVDESGLLPAALSTRIASRRVADIEGLDRGRPNFFYGWAIRTACTMSRIDTLAETERGNGILCKCSKPARITARGLTLCYECFDEDMGYVSESAGDADQRMRERIRESDRIC
jgi:hypothetical protein